MATTTASLTISSSDLTADVLSLSTSTQLKKAGTNTGLDQTTGAARVKYATAQTDTVLFAAADYTTSPAAHKIYIKNPSVNSDEYITISMAATTPTFVDIGRLYAGDFAILPWDGTANFAISTSDINMKVEYVLIHEG